MSKLAALASVFESSTELARMLTGWALVFFAGIGVILFYGETPVYPPLSGIHVGIILILVSFGVAFGLLPSVKE